MKTAHSLLWVTMGLLILCSFMAPFLSPYPPELQFRSHANEPPSSIGLFDDDWRLGPFSSTARTGNGQKAPGSARIQFLVEGRPFSFLGFVFSRRIFGIDREGDGVFLLGTDSLGRDLFSRFLFGLRFSFLSSLTAVLAAVSIGGSLGAAAGYFGGWTDRAIMRLCDLFLSLPGLFLVLGLRALFPLELSSSRSFWLVVLIFALLGWSSIARVLRGQVDTIKRRDHVRAARLLGASDTRILLWHILPLTVNAVLVQATFFLPLFLMAEVTLSYLGVGVQEPGVSLGLLLKESSTLQSLFLHQWKLVPALLIFALIFCLNLSADSLKSMGRVRSQWW